MTASDILNIPSPLMSPLTITGAVSVVTGSVTTGSVTIGSVSMITGDVEFSSIVPPSTSKFAFSFEVSVSRT